MKRKIVALLCALAVAGTSQSFAVMQNVKAAEQTVGTTYYFSSNGDNSNDGTAENEAWQTLDKLKGIQLQAGDRILLEAGSVFDGFIHLKGVKGTQEAPIQIGMYGEGKRPVINTKGQGIWYQNYGKQLDYAGHKNHDYVSSSILLYDSEYIEIENLEITNRAPEIENSYNQPDVMNRTGVAAVAQNIGTADHIYLKNLYIHDVIGNVYDKHMNNGGIYFTQSKPENETETGVAKYDDVKIENCHVENVNRWGIAVGYTYNWDRFQTAQLADATMEKYASSNVEIRNNYVKDAGGDAITTMYCDRPLVEYNVSDGAARQINNTDYAHSVNGGKVAAAVWPWKCKDAIFQYNEVFDTCQNQDGQAWDADWGDGTVYQYNYSHNNGGGSVMFCGVQAVNNVFRYNISQNDLGGVINPAGQPDAHVYNNTFYVKEGIDFIRTNMGGGPMVVENNIIYYSGQEPKEENWFKHTNAGSTKYDNNLYFNYTEAPSNDANAILEDPKFEDAGKAPQAAQTAVNERTAFDGYKLKADSPAIHTGKYISNHGGLDFFGNTVDTLTPDIGAHQTNTESDKVVYKVVSDVYKMTNDTIEGVERGTLVSDFLKNLKYDARVTVQVMNGDTAAEQTDKVVNGMTLQLVYNDEVVKTYQIDVVRVYAEYSPAGMTAEVGSAQQGNATEGGGELALDNNLNTIWHTDWNGCDRADTWIAIDMKQEQKIEMLKYVPRMTGKNGLITAYEIYVSDDGENWGEAITKGTWENDSTVKYAQFHAVNTRYVKLVATETQSTVAGKIFASAAEIRLGYEDTDGTVTNPEPDREIVYYNRAEWSAEAGSSQNGGGANPAMEGPANLVLDGNDATIWHTDWNGCSRADTWIAIDMKEEKKISALRYLPKNQGNPDGLFNGNILGYEVYVSNDGKTWGEAVTSGTWGTEPTIDEKVVTFDEVTARYVKLVATDSYLAGGSIIWAQAAEIEIGYEEAESV